MERKQECDLKKVRKQDLVSLVLQMQDQLDARAHQIASLTEKIDRLTESIENLSATHKNFQRIVFGKKSEKLPPIASEIRRIVQAEELTIEGEKMPRDPKQRDVEKRRKRRAESEPARKKSRKLKKNLPIIRECIEVAPQDIPDGYCREDLRELPGGEPIRRIEHVREHLVVVEYQLQTFATKDDHKIIKARAPEGVSEGCIYGPGLHAHVAVAKCADSLPFYRVARSLERAGMPLARSTVCTLFHRTALVLRPIWDKLFELARRDRYLHADETTLPVQAQDKCATGWIWGLMTANVIVFAFANSRSAKVATELLSDSVGYLTVDGYSGYNANEASAKGRTRVGCWAHARRKFHAALASNPAAQEVLEMIVELYLIERRVTIKGLRGTCEHAKIREQESAEIVRRIEAWVDEEKPKHSPRSMMGKAITYARNQRVRLSRFLEDPKLPLDNNYAERSLRIIAMGRKNFLFAGNEAGAENLAIVQSIVSTCQLHGINPYEYIRDVITRIGSHKRSLLEELLPWNWRPLENTARPALMTG